MIPRITNNVLNLETNDVEIVLVLVNCKHFRSPQDMAMKWLSGPVIEDMRKED